MTENISQTVGKMKTTSIQTKKIHLAWVISILALISMLFIARYIAPKVVHTPAKNMTAFIVNIPYATDDDINPEPLEHFQYMLSLSIPFFTFCIFFTLLRIKKNMTTVFIQIGLKIGLLCEKYGAYVILYFVIHSLRTQQKIYSYVENLHLYFIIVFLLLFKFSESYLSIIELNTNKIWTAFKKINFVFEKKNIYSIIAYGLIFWVSLLSYYPGKSPSGISANIIFTMDEFAAAVNGLTPGVDFVSQYSNFLPIFLLPIFKFFECNTFTFSLVMTILNFACLFCFYKVLRNITKTRFYAILLFLPILGGYLYPIAEYANGYRYFIGSYYGAFPLRFVLVLLLLLTFVYYCKKQNLISTLTLFALGIITAINNLDFGIPAFGAVIVTWSCLQIREYRINRFSISKNTLTAFIGILLGLIFYLIPILIHTHGKFPSLSNLTLFQRIFAKEGFYMKPMPGWIGIHSLIYLTYIGSIAVGLFELLLSDISTKKNVARIKTTVSALLLFLGILGLGMGMYYVGRTHWHTLVVMFPIWTLTLSTLFVYLSDVTNLENLSKEFTRGLIQIIILSILVLFSFGLKDLPSIREQFTRLIFLESRAVQSENTIAKLKSLIPINTKTLLLFEESHRLANDIQVINIFPFAHPTMVLVKQMDYMLDIVDDSGIENIYSNIACFNFFENYLRRRSWVPKKIDDDIVIWSRNKI